MSDSTTPAAAAPAVAFEHIGRAPGMMPIVIKNALLNIITLSFYRFWGKTAVRQFLWRNTKFMDEGLEYTGTGVELLIGFLIVAVVVFLPLGVANTVVETYADPTNPIFGVYLAAVYLVFLFLIGQAVFRARRYRLSRTVWRGIRGGIDGSPHRFAFYYMGYTLALILSLGWAYPWMRTRVFERLMSQSLFGNRHFKVDISCKPLYRRFALLWLVVALGVFGPVIAIAVAAGVAQWETGGGAAMPAFVAATPVLIFLTLIPAGLAFAWYRLAEFRLFAKSLSFEGLRFNLNATFGGLLWVVIGNMLIMWVSLGFGHPFTQMRIFQFVGERLQISGAIDVDGIRQSQLERPSVGEGLADAFDMGAV
jgi:uncharacterized membrane protein YjgN (DUF898 family)